MKRPRGPFSFRLLVHVLILRPLLRIVFGATVEGRENLQGLDRFVLVANHNSHLDTLLIYLALPVRQILTTHPVAARDYFIKHRLLFAAVNFLFRPIWVDRDQGQGDPIAEMVEKIDQGSNLVMYPEGTRGEPGEIQRFKSGIGRVLVRQQDLPVVPVFLLGPERSLPKKALLPLPICHHVIVGRPQLLKGKHHNVTRSLQQSIEDLARSETADRHRREPARKKPLVVAVIGIDGSGKSTVSRAIARVLSSSREVCWISDILELLKDGGPREMQPLLVETIRERIGGMAKRARSLAGYKIPKLTELLLRNHLLDETQRWYRPGATVVDGFPLLNLTAWAVLYREEYFNEEFCKKALAILSDRQGDTAGDDPLFRQFPELSYLKRFRLNRLRMPDAAIFLDVAPATCMSRIDARGEHKQVHETEEKLSKLRDAYLMVCRVAEREFGVPVSLLEGERPLDEVTTEALNFIQSVRATSHEE